MISSCLTFVGSFIAVFVWAILLTLMVPSSVKRAGLGGRELVSAVLLAGLYVLVERLIRRHAPGTTYLRLVRNVFLVSLIGTAAIYLCVFGMVLYLGDLRYPWVAMRGMAIEGGLLVLSNFITVLALKTTGYALGIGRDVSMK